MINDEVTYREWEQVNGRGQWVTHKAYVSDEFPADLLPLGLVGSRFRSITYNSKNQTAYARPAHVYELTDIYAHRNGNIVVNNGQYYLKSDTMLELLIDI